MKKLQHLWQTAGIKFTWKAIGRMLFWGIVLFLLWVFLLTGNAFQHDAVRLFDEVVLQFFFQFRNGPLNGVAVDITALGSATIVALFTLIGAIVLLLSNDKYGALQLAVAAIGNSFLSPFFKTFYERDRPSVVPHLVDVMHFSYPSGHSLAAASMYLTLALLGCKHLKVWNAQVLLLGMAGLVILLIGVSRIYLGVHYPSDVLGGMSLGAAWALLLGWLVSLLERGKKPKVHSE